MTTSKTDGWSVECWSFGARARWYWTACSLGNTPIDGTCLTRSEALRAAQEAYGQFEPRYSDELTAHGAAIGCSPADAERARRYYGISHGTARSVCRWLKWTELAWPGTER